MPDPGVSYLFMVTIDSVRLGNFTKITGLSAKYETETVKEGGENSHLHHLPGRVTYSNVILTRPVDYGSSGLAAWFTKFQNNAAKGSKTSRNTASILAFGANQLPIAEWTLLDVVPVSYTGPTLNAAGAEVLTESVELAHSGFWNMATSYTRMSAKAAVTAASALAKAKSAKRDLDLQSRAGAPLGGL
jgi:phage tail-like protein